MARWTSISADDLKAAGHGAIVDRGKRMATGSTDPVTEEISNATARVRRAVAAGNAVDTDETKIPKSLKGLTVRMALYLLMERISLPLSEDQRETRKSDNSDLLRIQDKKVLLEAPDDEAAADAGFVPQNRGSWNSENKVIGRMHPTPRPARQMPPPADDSAYANPDATEDSDV